MIAQNLSDPLVCCTQCGSRLPGVLLNAPSALPCANCGAGLQVEVFPALFLEPDSIEVGDSLQAEDEASCFFHPGKRAVVACTICGRFLCALCDVTLAGQRLCPTCVELGRSQGRLTDLITHRTLYDQVALSMAIIPLLIFWLTIITAPMTLYVAVRYWKAPSSLLPRTKIRFILAIAIAGLQVAGWATASVYWLS